MGYMCSFSYFMKKNARLPDLSHCLIKNYGKIGKIFPYRSIGKDPSKGKENSMLCLTSSLVQNHDSEGFNSTKVYLEKSLDCSLGFFWQTFKSFYNSKHCQCVVLCTLLPHTSSKSQILTGTNPPQAPAALFINTQNSTTSAT